MEIPAYQIKINKKFLKLTNCMTTLASNSSILARATFDRVHKTRGEGQGVLAKKTESDLTLFVPRVTEHLQFLSGVEAGSRIKVNLDIDPTKSVEYKVNEVFIDEIGTDFGLTDLNRT